MSTIIHFVTTLLRCFWTSVFAFSHHLRFPSLCKIDLTAHYLVYPVINKYFFINSYLRFAYIFTISVILILFRNFLFLQYAVLYKVLNLEVSYTFPPIMIHWHTITKSDTSISYQPFRSSRRALVASLTLSGVSLSSFSATIISSSEGALVSILIFALFSVILGSKRQKIALITFTHLRAKKINLVKINFRLKCICLPNFKIK